MSDQPATAPQKVSPHLVCSGAAAAIDFYRQAFGARETIRVPGPDGKLIHACVEIDGSPASARHLEPEWRLS
jgi:uncharacterized glyoxalase superfamily protein PhnB